MKSSQDRECPVKSPPEKGGLGGYVPYDPSLTKLARENRKTPTPAKKRLWVEVLHNRQFAGLKFTRQKPLDRYIVDFYCAELMLAVEIDGDSHSAQEDYDRERTDRLKNLGVEVIRYNNGNDLTNIESVYEDLARQIAQCRRTKPSNSPFSRGSMDST